MLLVIFYNAAGLVRVKQELEFIIDHKERHFLMSNMLGSWDAKKRDIT